MPSRRKFLEFLGLGSAAAACLPALAADKAVAGQAGSVAAFRFQCFCGENVVAAVPTDEQKNLVVNCPQCKHGYNLTWHGDHFSFSDNWGEPNYLPEPAGPMFIDRDGFELKPVEEAMAVLKSGAFRPGDNFKLDPPTPRR
jgi:hypothetical protein